MAALTAHRRAVALVVFAMAAALVLTACGARRETDALGLSLSKPVTRQLLQDRPESALLYPGSRAVRKVGADEQAQPGGEHEPDPAYAGSVATASVDAASLFAWYSTQLGARGYQPATYYPLSTQVEGRAWTIPHTKDQIQVAVYRDGQGPARQVSIGAIEYEEILVAYRVTGPPPNAR
ncbi:MAG TPA: hypothetical protein VFN80_09360 [Acidothermaceae bacterium]|nr:hypothetical protein [Acidothermaceae bacterium]